MRWTALAATLGLIAMSPLHAREAEPPFYTDRSRLLVALDAQGREHPVRSPADWARRRAHIVAGMQLVMGPLPDDSRRVPLDVQVIEETTLPRVIRRKISFAAEKGDRVPTWLFLPRRRQGRAPGVLCLHPTSPRGKDVVAGLTDRPNRSYALELAQRGIVTLAPDYLNMGDYRCDWRRLGYASATMKGIWNHRRAIDLLAALPEVDADRIGCIGHSLGGHNTLFLAVFEPRVKAAVSSCGFNAFAKYKGGDLTGWTHDGYMPRIATVYGKDPTRMPFDFTEVIAALAPRPCFVNAPLRDDNFEVSGVRDCIAAAAPVYALFGAKHALVAHYPDAGHDFPPDIRDAAYAFLRKALTRPDD